MGFITGQNIIITSDWQIDKKSIMTAQQKCEDISTYKEDESTKIIKPTQKVIRHFEDKIGYSTTTIRIWSIQNNRLEIVTQFSNLIQARTLEEIIEFFSDTRYQFYLSKVVHTGVFKAYFTQFDNIHTENASNFT